MNPPIRILILTDSLKVKKWVADIVNFVLDSSEFEICGVVINNSNNTSRSSFLYRLLRFFDRKIFKAKSDPFQSVNLLFNTSLIYNTIPIQKQFSDWVDDECLAFVKEKNPDLILRFGFRILRGPLLGISKFGVWSLHHGDNKTNRGGPPCFWEVVQQYAISGVTLQQITEDLDGGKVIGRAFTKTDLLSFHRNQVNVFEIGVRLFQEKLKQLSKDNLEIENAAFDFYSHSLCKDPNNVTSFFILLKYSYRVVKRAVFNFIYDQQWVINHSKNNNFEESIYRFQQLTPPKGTSWADPFPVIWKDQLYLFAEEIVGKNYGKIVCFSYLSDQKCFGKPITIIEKPFHLSYPMVFQYEKEWYMIPEMGETGMVILYKANNFPFDWEKQQVLISDKKLFDVTPFEYNSKWFCFASERTSSTTSANDLLQLYQLNDGILGTWTLHPASPIKIDVRGGRSAGKVFSKNGKTYRPAQLGAPKYGYGIQLYEILELNDFNYREQLVESILPNWNNHILATHTFNQVDGWQFIDSQRLVSKFKL